MSDITITTKEIYPVSRNVLWVCPPTPQNKVSC